MFAAEPARWPSQATVRDAATRAAAGVGRARVDGLAASTGGAIAELVARALIIGLEARLSVVATLGGTAVAAPFAWLTGG